MGEKSKNYTVVGVNRDVKRRMDELRSTLSGPTGELVSFNNLISFLIDKYEAGLRK